MTHTGVSVNSVRGFICCMFVHICYNTATWLFRFSVSQNMQQSTSMWLLATVSYLTPWMIFCQSFFKYLDHKQCFYIQPKWHQIALHQLNKHWEAFGTVHDLPTLVGWGGEIHIIKQLNLQIMISEHMSSCFIRGWPAAEAPFQICE